MVEVVLCHFLSLGLENGTFYFLSLRILTLGAQRCHIRSQAIQIMWTGANTKWESGQYTSQHQLQGYNGE